MGWTQWCSELPICSFVHRQLECQVGGAVSSGPGFCEKRVCVGGSRAGEHVGDVGEHRTGQDAGLVQGLPVCRDPWQVAFTEDRAGSDTRPHHVLLGTDLRSGTASFWNLWPSCLCWWVTSSPPGTRAFVGSGGCFTLWEFQSKKPVYGREGGGTGACSWGVPFWTPTWPSRSFSSGVWPNIRWN